MARRRLKKPTRRRSTRKGMRRRTARRAYSSKRGNPMLPTWTKTKWAYLAYGAALGFIFRDSIGASMIGGFLDDTSEKLRGAKAGLGQVFDPYGAVAINPYGAVAINPYGAVHDPYGYHNLRAEMAARTIGPGTAMGLA